MSEKLTPRQYSLLLKEIKERVRAAQYQALKAVNKELIGLYWDIGRLIVERQKGDTWGKAVVEKLSKDLQYEFSGIKGFSYRNIWNMRNFYCCYAKNEKLQTLSAEITWSSNVAVLESCEDNLEREFYIRMARRFGWSVRRLKHQIENKTYERTLLNQTNFHLTLPEKNQDQAKLAVKDEYFFDFLELGEKYDESYLEKAMILKVEKFLQEMGGIFSFIGSQYRLEVEDKEYFIDILLYHRTLKCLVAIELKIGEFIPEYIGKMQFYLAVLDDKVKMPDENPSIGIVLCRDKNKTIVEYALRDSKKPIGVAKYQVLNKLPEDLKGTLPSAEQIDRLLGKI